MLTRQFIVVAAAVVVVSAASAAADPPSTRNGVQLGQAWAHPFVSVTSSYDSLTVWPFLPTGGPGTAGDVVLRPSLGADLHLDNANTRVNATAKR